MFSCEYCEILKNTYFVKHLRTAASEKRQKSGIFDVGKFWKKWNCRQTVHESKSCQMKIYEGVYSQKWWNIWHKKVEIERRVYSTNESRTPKLSSQIWNEG